MNFFDCSNLRSLKSSIESIATRAEVGKTSIYRHWESKEYLIIEALSHLRTEMPILDTGNLREDLFAPLKSASQVVNPVVEQIELKLIGETRSQPQLYPVFHERLIAPRLRQIINLIERAQAHVELRQDLNPLLVLDLIAGAGWYGILFTRYISPAPSDLPEQIVDNTVLRGNQKLEGKQ